MNVINTRSPSGDEEAARSSPPGTLVFVPAGERVRWDGRARALYGVEFPETGRAALLDPIAPEHRDVVARALSEASADASRGGFSVEFRLDGARVRWMRIEAVNAVGAGGAFTLVGTLTDVTARYQQDRDRAHVAQREAVRSRVGQVLSATLDYETVLRSVMDLAVPAVGDFGFLDLIEGAQVRRVARAHEDLRRQAMLDQTKWERSERTDLNLCALSTGLTGIHRHIGEPWFRNVAMSEEHYAGMKSLDFGSMITVPVRAGEDLLGSLTLFYAGGGRQFDSDDVGLAQEIATRGAVAIANARVYAQATEAVRDRDEILAVASHELRTPLTTLSLTLQQTRRALENRDAAHATARLEAAEKQVDRLAQLTGELLDASRLGLGALELQPGPGDLAEVVREVADRFAGVPKTPVQLEGVGAPLMGRWDVSRLDQVLTNLLANAVKYGAGKPVTVTVRNLGARVQVRVADQGIGIAAEEQGRIFARFGRARGVGKFAGTGLGLWISRRFVEAMGGTLTVESQPSNGATFVVELPRG